MTDFQVFTAFLLALSSDAMIVIFSVAYLCREYGSLKRFIYNRACGLKKTIFRIMNKEIK